MKLVFLLTVQLCPKHNILQPDVIAIRSFAIVRTVRPGLLDASAASFNNVQPIMNPSSCKPPALEPPYQRQLGSIFTLVQAVPKPPFLSPRFSWTPQCPGVGSGLQGHRYWASCVKITRPSGSSLHIKFALSFLGGSCTSIVRYRWIYGDVQRAWSDFGR